MGRRAVRRDGNLHVYDFCCDDGCSQLHAEYEQFHVDSSRGGDGNGHGVERSRGDQLPNDVFGEFCERCGCSFDGDGGRRIDVRWLERSGGMPGNGYMHCDSERGSNCDGYVQQRDFSSDDRARSGKPFDGEYDAGE